MADDLLLNLRQLIELDRGLGLEFVERGGVTRVEGAAPPLPTPPPVAAVRPLPSSAGPAPATALVSYATPSVLAPAPLVPSSAPPVAAVVPTVRPVAPDVATTTTAAPVTNARPANASPPAPILPAPLTSPTPLTSPAMPARPAQTPDSRPQTPDSSAGLTAATLATIAAQVAACKSCGLCATRTNTVPGEGSPATELLFVGEGPGADEDASGRPFVGKAGELLTRMIEAMGFQRGEVFIANVVKCRPPGNRLPEPAEIAACLPFLHAQIAALKPKVICTLGNTPLRALLGDDKLGITKLRGTHQSFQGIPLIPTFHPAYLLRNPPAKKPCWEDLKVVLSVLGRTPPVKRSETTGG